MRKVVVAGTGMTKIGRSEESLLGLFTTAAQLAIADAGVDAGAIQAIYVANVYGGVVDGQLNISPQVATALGLDGVATARIEAACASGGLAFHQACLAIWSGVYDMVLVVGAERLRHQDSGRIADQMQLCLDGFYEAGTGVTFGTLWALVAESYMHRYGLTRAELSAVAVKNHANAMSNPKAQFHKAITIQDVAAAQVVSSPLTVYDYSPFSDGGAAVVLAAPEALAAGKEQVRVLGSAVGTDRSIMGDRRDICAYRAITLAAQRAYAQANVRPADMDLLEVHDCATINEIVALESLGIFDPGKAGTAAANGVTALTGRLPVNPSGGLKARGHPIAATGLAQVVEIADQLRGRAGARQVRSARLGLCQNMGGNVSLAAVTILQGGG